MQFTKQEIEQKLTAFFSEKETFSKNDLADFYKIYEPEVKEGTLGWRIYDLKKKHLIKSVRKGYYTLERKQTFKPQPDKLMFRIASFLNKSTIDFNYSLWTTAWLNEFIELQATSFLYVLEVDKEYQEGIFFSLKDADIVSNIFLKPDTTVIQNYVSELLQAVIIERLITRSPVHKTGNIVFPALEKILVDLFCDDKLFFAYQGSQMVKIYEVCFTKYHINFSRFFNYAKRRKREGEIRKFLSQHSELYQKIKDIIE